MKKKYLFLLLVIFSGCGLWWAINASSSKVDPKRPAVILTPQKAVPSPGPATAWRLVLQFKDNKVTVASALPRRSAVTKPRIDPTHLLAGKSILLEYRGVDVTGHQVFIDYIVIPLTAVAEFLDPDNDNKLRSIDETLTDPWVKVALPFDASVTAIEFSRVEPDATTAVGLWTRIPLNTVPLTQVKETP